MHEVVGRRRRRIDRRRACARPGPQLTWGHRKVFGAPGPDGRRAARATARRASSPRAVTLYHVVVEATLAQPGQHIIETRSRRSTSCPASAPGCATSRSTSSATSASASSCWPTSTEDARSRRQDAIVAAIREVLPLDDRRRQAARLGRALHRVLRLHAGGPRRGGRAARRSRSCARSACRSTTCHASRADGHALPRERARRGLIAARRPTSSARAARSRATRRRWRSCSTRIARSARGDQVPHGHDDRVGLPRRRPVAPAARRPSRAARIRDCRRDGPTSRFRCSFDDWVNLSAGRLDARRLMLTRRLRLRGNPRALLRRRARLPDGLADQRRDGERRPRRPSRDGRARARRGCAAPARRRGRRGSRRSPRARRAGAGRPRPAWPRSTAATCSRVRRTSSANSAAISGLRRESVKTSKESVRNSVSSRSIASSVRRSIAMKSCGVGGGGQLLVERGHPQVGVALDDLGEQPLLGAEVVVQQPARDAGLASDVVERRARDAAQRHRRAHRVDDPLRLLAAELRARRWSRLHALRS